MLRSFSRVVKVGHCPHLTTPFAKRGLQGLVVGVPKESLPGEERVAMNPTLAAKLIKNGATVKIQEGAGLGSGYSDELYKQLGPR